MGQSCLDIDNRLALRAHKEPKHMPAGRSLFTRYRIQTASLMQELTTRLTHTPPTNDLERRRAAQRLINKSLKLSQRFGIHQANGWLTDHQVARAQRAAKLPIRERHSPSARRRMTQVTTGACIHTICTITTLRWSGDHLLKTEPCAKDRFITGITMEHFPVAARAEKHAAPRNASACSRGRRMATGATRRRLLARLADNESVRILKVSSENLLAAQVAVSRLRAAKHAPYPLHKSHSRHTPSP